MRECNSRTNDMTVTGECQLGRLSRRLQELFLLLLHVSRRLSRGRSVVVYRATVALQLRSSL